MFTTNDIIYLNHDGVILQESGSGRDPSRNTVIRSTRTGNDATVFHLGVRDLSSSENWDGAVAGSVVSIVGVISISMFILFTHLISVLFVFLLL